jgi:hypothetical protein
MNNLHCKGIDDICMVFVLKDKDMASDTKRTDLNYRFDRGACWWIYLLRFITLRINGCNSEEITLDN